MEQSVIIKQLQDISTLKEVEVFQRKIWGTELITPLPQLVAAIHHGGSCFAAYDQHLLVGFVYGFSGYQNKQNILVSHMMAIDPAFRNRGIGELLKRTQKKWAENYGYEKIVWTFDPLESRNAYLNLHKLGAYVRTYYNSYYGELDDGLNQGLPTDRFLVEWDIYVSEKENFLQREDTAEKIIDFSVQDQFAVPKVNSVTMEDPVYLIGVPANIQKLKKSNLQLAKEWRSAQRKIFTEAFAKGYRTVDFIAAQKEEPVSFYIIEKIAEK
ncbi:GNAT family N-acetyltransferase [Bacillaceae bacterium Marseille-Q3522]|nr:GNAT family N-acetyltransferase [Bacillaceae bacterium Marseille-Q3522]